MSAQSFDLKHSMKHCGCIAAAMASLIVAASITERSSAQQAVPPRVREVSDALMSQDSVDVPSVKLLSPTQIREVVDILVEQAFGLNNDTTGTYWLGFRGINNFQRAGGILPASAVDVVVERLNEAARPLENLPSSAEASIRSDHKMHAVRLAVMVLKADGAKNVESRLHTLPVEAASVYSALAAEEVRRAFAEPGTMYATDWSKSEAVSVLGVVQEFVKQEFESAKKEPLSKDRMQTACEIMNRCAGMAMAPEFGAAARELGAWAYVELDRAMGEMIKAAKWTEPPPGWTVPISPMIVSIAGLTGLPFNRPNQATYEAFGRALTALSAVGADALDGERLSRIIVLLDEIATSIDLIAKMANPPQRVGEPVSVQPICDGCTQLVARIAAIHVDDPAWTTENRCSWIAAVDRDRPVSPTEVCASIRAEWINAKAALPDAWREECAQRKPDAAVDGAAVDKQPAAPPVPATPQ